MYTYSKYECFLLRDCWDIEIWKIKKKIKNKKKKKKIVEKK